MAEQRIAIIGARGHTGYVQRGLELRPDARVIALADGAPDCPAEPVAAWCAQHGHAAQRFDDWRRMLDVARPDAVVVCGPFELHARMTADAIDRGIHVFVEKLAALSFEDLALLRGACRARPDVHVAGMMGKRYDPGFYTAWQLVRQGAVGEVRLIDARKSYKLGRRDAYYDRRDTYGGTIPWVGSHAIDWILWLLDFPPVESIVAAHSTGHNEGHGDMERSAVCQLRFSGGLFASASIDLFRPPAAPTHGDDWVRVMGTRGVIEARERSLMLIDQQRDGSQAVDVACDRQVFADFLDHIAGVRPALIDAAQTLMLTELCLLARQSADEDRIVRVGGELGGQRAQLR